MERIHGGSPVKRKTSIESGFSQYPDFDVDNLPCLCKKSGFVTMMRRGRENHAIYWAECRDCGRQWQAALTLHVAVGYYVFAMVAEKDPYEFKVRKKKKPKVKLEPEEEMEEKKSLNQMKEHLRLLSIQERQLKEKKAELLARKKKK